MEDIKVVSIDQAYEDLQKARKPGAKDIKPRKKRVIGGASRPVRPSKWGSALDKETKTQTGPLIRQFKRAQGYLKHGRINQGVAVWEGAKKRFKGD